MEWKKEGHPPMDITKSFNGDKYWEESRPVPILYRAAGELHLGYGRYRVFATHEEWHVDGTNGIWEVVYWYDLPEPPSER